MKGKFLLLLGILSLTTLVHTETSESPVRSGSNDEPSCSRVMCRMFCPYGFLHDENGCPLCTCNEVEDPCEMMTCEAGEICKFAHDCSGFSCRSTQAECVPEVPCAMPMCAEACPNGYRNDADGCMTCQCIEKDADHSDELCMNHPCPDAHSCVAVKPPLCEVLGHGACNKRAMCLPDAHGGMFLPHLAEHTPGEFGSIPQLKNVPDILDSVCKFRKGFSQKLKEEASIKYANSSMLGRLLRHGAMHNPLCGDDGKFKPLQCHLPDQACWCVNDRGHPVPGSKQKIQSKADIPKCFEHVTQRIEGQFLMQHQLGDVENHLTKIGSVLQDHLATWMKLDHAQINIRQVSQTRGGLLEVHFELARTDESELHSAELMLSWHFGHKDCRVPYMGSDLIPVHKSLKMKHHTSAVDENGVFHDISEEPTDRNWFVEKYRHNKVAVIAGCVSSALFVIFVIAVVVTVLKRGKVTGNHFKHRRMSEKSKTYKENLAFANDLYAVQQQKPGVEPEKAAEPEEKPEEKPEGIEA